MLDTLLNLDKYLLLLFNGSDSVLLDGMVVTWTSGVTWIPLYFALFYLVIRSNETMTQIGIIVLCCAFCLLMAGGLIELAIKPFVARLRPLNNYYIKDQLILVKGVYESNYSFFSAHAANTFSIALFFSLLVKNKVFTKFMVAWSLINCYTRLYLGVHYPSDVIIGLLYGGILGLIAYQIYLKLYIKTLISQGKSVNNCLKKNYLQKDIKVVLFTFSILFFYILIKGLLFTA